MNLMIKNPNLIEYFIDLKDKDLCETVITESIYNQIHKSKITLDRDAREKLRNVNYIIEGHQTLLGIELIRIFAFHCMTKKGNIRKYPQTQRWWRDSGYLGGAKVIRDRAAEYGWENVYDKVPEWCFNTGGKYIACLIEKI